MTDEQLSIILPVFNEAGIVKDMIREVYEESVRLGIGVEIIAVNDGSTDETLKVLNQFIEHAPYLKVISHQSNQGYGSALRSGIKAARYEWVLFMDADGQFHINSLESVWNHRKEYDVLLGYRQKRADDGYRLMMGKLGNTVSNILVGQNIQDINCGFKLFKKELIQSLPLSSTGGIINFEILYCLFRKHKNLRFHQFPVQHYPRSFGRSTGGNPGVIAKIIVEGARILFRF